MGPQTSHFTSLNLSFPKYKLGRIIKILPHEIVVRIIWTGWEAFHRLLVAFDVVASVGAGPPSPPNLGMGLSYGDSRGARQWEGRLGPGRLTGAGLLCPQALRDASVLIFANKQDMKDSMSTVEISRFLTLSAIKDHPWHIQGCCALTGEGLVTAPPAPPEPGPTNG